MSVVQSKKLPYLCSYVGQEKTRLRRQRRSIWRTGPILGAIALWAVIIAISAVVGSLTGKQFLLWAITSLPVPLAILGGMAAMDFKLSKPRTAEEHQLKTLYDGLTVYENSLKTSRLHKDLDFATSQLLEATAMSWTSIRERLDGPLWASPESTLHLRALRQEMLSASDQAMREAVMLGLRCMAPAGTATTPGDQIMESISHLDLEGVLDGFKQSIKGQKVYESPRFGEVSEQLYGIAHRMRALSSEVDRLTAESASKSLGGVTSATQTLDAALQSLQDVRRAESELDEEARLRERL